MMSLMNSSFERGDPSSEHLFSLPYPMGTGRTIRWLLKQTNPRMSCSLVQRVKFFLFIPQREKKEESLEYIIWNTRTFDAIEAKVNLNENYKSEKSDHEDQKKIEYGSTGPLERVQYQLHSRVD